MKKIIFLDEVIEIHKYQIDKYGGIEGIRDLDLLKSAIDMPRSGIGNEFFHKNIFEMASAYLYHIIKNHPFLDGNKRVAFGAMDIFLQMNGLILKADENELYKLIIDIASGKDISKFQIANFLKENTIYYKFSIPD